MVDYRSLEHCARMIIESGPETEHRVGVTVSDPNHPMVSKRKETYLKHVRVKAKNELHAAEKAKAYFKKKGYRVHDTINATVKEEKAHDQEVHDHHQLLKSKSTDEILKIHRARHKVTHNYSARDAGGKDAMISSLLRDKFGNKRVAAHFGLDEDIGNSDKFVGNKQTDKPVPVIKPTNTQDAKTASLARSNAKERTSQTMGNNVEEGALDAADTAAEYLVPYYSAGKKLYKGDKAGAAQDAAIDTALLATTGGVGKVLGGAARAGSKLLGGAVRSGEKAGIKAGEKAAITGAEKAGASALEKDAAKVAATDAEKAAGKVAATDALKTAGKGLATAAMTAAGRTKPMNTHIPGAQHANIVGYKPNTNVHRAMKHRRMAEETGTDARETIEAMPRSDIKDRKDVQYVGRPDSAPSPMDKRSVLIRQEIQKKVIDESKRNADIIKQVKKEKGNTQQKETTMGDRKTRVFGDVIINPQLNDPNPGSGTVTS